MKKTLFSLIACLVFSQASFAAESPLVESGNEIVAIVDAFTGVDTTIPAGQFIVDIRRKTKAVFTTGKVNYIVVTRLPTGTTNDHCGRNAKKIRCQTYLVTLDVEANPAIGPNVITVTSIVPLRGKRCPKCR